MNDFEKILGLKVVALKGVVNEYDKRKKNPRIEVRYILFDDGETYIILEEQDYYSYHDCSASARHIQIWKDKLQWEYYNTLPDANDW